ncbi:hypothetical protein NL676_028868 [Syzygium grande]|nr:hypothetical protein NL676_028868 [Syzygium grande]
MIERARRDRFDGGFGYRKNERASNHRRRSGEKPPDPNACSREGQSAHHRRRRRGERHENTPLLVAAASRESPRATCPKRRDCPLMFGPFSRESSVAGERGPK